MRDGDRMKVVHVITGTSLGGAEIMLDTLLRALSPACHCTVVSLMPLGTVGERIRARGIPIESLDMDPGRPNPAVLLRLVRHLRRLRPDVVHTWMYHADLLGGVAARLAGTGKVAWAIHNSTLSRRHVKARTRAVVRACAWLSRRVPHRILCCSEVAQRLHVDWGYPSDRIEIVPNGFDVSRFRPDAQARAAVRAELGVSAQAPLVGLIARYDPQKNHAGFLQAAAAVRRRHPEARFLLAGTRVDAGNAALLDQVGAHGLQQAVHLLGPRDDVPRLMASLDLLVSASGYGEAFPIVLGEAMASGVPCVATDVGDCASIVADTGAIAPVDDPAALAAAIADLLEEGPEALARRGRHARERIVRHFAIERVAAQYESFYRTLASTGG